MRDLAVVFSAIYVLCWMLVTAVSGDPVGSAIGLLGVVAIGFVGGLAMSRSGVPIE